MSTRALGAALVAGSFFLGCGGKNEPIIECPSALGPEVATAAVLRLDTVDVGERGRWRTIGSNLDGRCTALDVPSSVACRNYRDYRTGPSADGADGIDNAFGRRLVPMMEILFGLDVSAQISGHSWLAFEGEGRATLYVGDDQKVWLVIPLIHARFSPSREGELSTLTAIIPRERFVTSLLAHGGLLVGPRLCGGSTIYGVAENVREVADIPLSGTPDPTAECDGISFAMRFVGTSAIAPPELPPKCGERTPTAVPVLAAGEGIVEPDP